MTLSSPSEKPPLSPKHSRGAEIDLDAPWHALEAEEVLRRLDAHPKNGLSPEEAAERLQRFGPNKLEEKKQTSAIVLFLLQFHQPLIYILLAAAGVAAFFGEFVDASVIVGVVLVNAIVGYVQESKAVHAIGALAKSLAVQATVVRGGEKKRIPAEEVVPGDLVLLEAGDKAPADLRLLRARELRMDESALTGESVAVEKRLEPLSEEAALADRLNMVYSGTMAAGGAGAGLAAATGMRSEIGRVSELTASAELLDTPLTRKIKRFSQHLLIVIMALAALTVAVGLLRGHALLPTLMAAVALAVAAIPEGLPAAVTIMLAIGVSRMAKRRAIIRRLPAVESLGGATVICSDKTGTLTRNEMTVKEILAGGQRCLVSGVGYDPEGGTLENEASEPFDLSANEALLECLHAGLACNDASVERADNGLWIVRGDPTEGALIVAARKAGLDGQAGEGLGGRHDVLPFESERQYMATLHGHPNGDDSLRLIYLKGSAERVLDRCHAALSPSGEHVSLDREALLTTTAEMASRGLRVLALARKEVPAGSALEHDHVKAELVFLGLQAMIDPPRPEAAEAIRLCHAAGIQVKMVTGDHIVTASAIARSLGIGGSSQAPSSDGQEKPLEALSGQDLAKMSDAELSDAAERVSVFARVAPEHKLRLVEALQARGHVVAMTGDGVNDSPALRRADIGVAMALGGTEVAREAADMVLTDDNFASIEAAVEEGRQVFNNLVKFIVWTLPTNGAEALVILLAIAFGATMPLLPAQLLWINMTTAICLGLTLAFEPKEKDLMTRPPRSPRASLLDRVLMERTILVSIFGCAAVFGVFEWELARGVSEGAARAASTATLVFIEMLYLFHCRSLRLSVFATPLFTNKILWLGIGVMMVLQLFFTYVPAMNRWFHVEPLDWIGHAKVWAGAFAVFVVVAIETWIRELLDSSQRETAST
jgi:cation-transporting ATPase F